MIEPLELSFTVRCSPAHAFATWTERASTWWPSDHTISAEDGVAITYEPRVGGRIYERTSDGVEHDWGEILVWEPPSRLVYSWHLPSTPAEATEVEVSFSAEGEATVVAISHRGWERLGADAERRRAANRRGWGEVLPGYERACAEVGRV